MGLPSPVGRLRSGLLARRLSASTLRLMAASRASKVMPNYAKAALSLGLDDARPMVAMTIDRYLSFTEGRQLYGADELVDLE